MNKSRLYIHIGTHKTGSTAIQHFLRQNDVLLRTKGFFCLQGLKEFKTLITSKEVNNKIITRCKKELESRVKQTKQKNTDQCFILSREGFSGNPLIGYKNAGIVAKRLSQITTNFDVYIIVYLRRQDGFVESMYTQQIHEGESYTFQSFLYSLPAFSFNWKHLLTCYSEYFGKENIIVRQYDKFFLPEPDSLLVDFCQILGIDIQNTAFHDESSKPNRGYSIDALEIAHL
ncbi:MAG TPA: hypothetical protein ENH23_06210 [candidate division Zixibacteria bacterium]|nr:hypothetical protein [candidate division Zixibacteria bacterium]